MVARYNPRWDERDKSGTPLEALFETYELFNRAERKSLSTVRWYDDKLRDFLRWLCGRDYGSTLAEITADRVREYVLYLQERDVKWERNRFSGPRPGKLAGVTI